MAVFELKPDKLLVPNWAGTGVQFNAHSYARMSGLTAAQFPDLERKVEAMSPQLVRIFYNHDHHGDPSNPARQSDEQKNRWASFVRTVQLAQSANATINVTWQSIVVKGRTPQEVKQERARKLGQFADLLEKLVKDPEQPITNLRWVTIQNEPNTPPRGATGKPRQVTPQTLRDAYVALHKLLKTRSLEKHIQLMGGDLIEGSADVESPYNHGAWFQFMSDTYADILKAYSVHIYWQYDKPHRFKHRLDDVAHVVAPLTKRPLYVTEFGVRGFDIKSRKNPTGVPAPGNFHVPRTGAKIPLGSTRVAAFQQAWFLITAALQGYAGVLKWDGYYGMYDKAPQAAYALGRPEGKRWPLYPSYHLLRMIMLTTQAGSSVPELQTTTGHTQRVAAFAADGELTFLGLDEQGATLEGRSQKTSTYEFSGLPAGKRFSLVIWNRAGGGLLVVDSTVTATTRGRAAITVPLHSVFALTSLEVQPL